MVDESPSPPHIFASDVVFLLVSRSSKLTTVIDEDLGSRGTTAGSNLFNGLDNIHPLNNRAKHHMLPIQPGRFGGAEEELRSVGVGTSVGHTKNTGTGMLQLEVFIGKLAVTGDSMRAIGTRDNQKRGNKTEV